MINNFEQRCQAAFPVVAFIANRHLIDHMRRMSAALDMDIDSALLWGLVALHERRPIDCSRSSGK